MGTKDDILDHALRLFNRSGTRSVSTNHIASAMGISPGNLYYHYRNKEEILRAIFTRLAASLGEVWEISIGSGLDAGDLKAVLQSHLTLMGEYRFLCREIPALVVDDEELRQGYRKLRHERLVTIEQVLKALVDNGQIDDPGGTAALKGLAEAMWVLGFFWVANVELGGEEPGPLQTRRGVSAVLQVLRPLATDLARQSLAD